MNEPTIEELKQAAKPLHELLCKYYHPHAMIVVQQNAVEVLIGRMAAPLPVPD